jgi:class 3 adenylate cyclase
MAPVGGQRRKVVTVVFADVVGSTAMGERVDPETLRWAIQCWFGRMRHVVERHGGMVEKARAHTSLERLGHGAAITDA